MDQQFRAGRDASCPQRLQSRRSAVGAFGAAVDDHAHLRVAGLIDQAFHFIAHLRVDDDDGVGDMRVLLERLDGPADDRLVVDAHQLLGVVRIEARTEAGGQYHGDDRCFGFSVISLSHTAHRMPRPARV